MDRNHKETTMDRNTATTDMCPMCVDAASHGMGELDPDYCVAEVDVQDDDGETQRVCVQCAEVVRENQQTA